MTVHLVCVKNKLTIIHSWLHLYARASPPHYAPPLSFHFLCVDLHILAEPADTVAVALSHNHTAHEDLNRSDALERHLALARRLVQTQLMAQLVFGNGVRVVDLVAEDHEGRRGEILHGEQGVQLGFGFAKALVVFGVDEEHNAANFGDWKIGGLVGGWEMVEGREWAYSSPARGGALVRGLRDRRW